MDSSQNNTIASNFAARFDGMSPRSFKEDGSGLVTAFTLAEVHLNANNQPVSISGSVTIKKNDQGSEFETISMLWNAAGIALGASPRPQLDLIRKYLIQA